MEVTRWKFEFESRPTMIGILVYVIFGIVGFFFIDDRIVFLPVAFFAGVVAGLLSNSHQQTGNNGIVVTLVGSFLVMVYSAALHVSSQPDSNDMAIGDQLFYGLVFFLAEGVLVIAILLPLGYIGAIAIGGIRKRRQPETEPRELPDSGR